MLLKKLILLLFSLTLSSAAFSDDVCFSPGKCANTLISFITASQKSIDVAIYSFTYKPIADALIAKHKAGIAVRVIADAGNAEASNSQILSLVAAGIPVKYGIQKSSGIMHDKLIILDGLSLETGSGIVIVVSVGGDYEQR